MQINWLVFILTFLLFKILIMSERININVIKALFMVPVQSLYLVDDLNNLFSKEITNKMIQLTTMLTV